MAERNPMARVASMAAALVLSYTNAAAAATEQTELVSVKSPVTTSQTPSDNSYITTKHVLSRTGRYAVFYSGANDVIPGQDNRSATRLFLRDRQTGTTRQLTASPTTLYIDTPSISDDGRYVAFVGYGDVLGNGQSAYTQRVYVMDTQNGAVEQISVGLGKTFPNDASSNAMISGNGRFIVYTSYATNLVAGDTNASSDVFETDRITHETRRVSVSSTGKQLNGYSQNPFASSNGRYVAFESVATNAVSVPGYVPQGVFLYDRNTGKSELVSINSRGVPADTGGASASVSDDGRYVAFAAQSFNLTPNIPNFFSQVFVRDRTAHTTTCASISSTGEFGNSNSISPVISGSGRFVVFASQSATLVPNDTNNSNGFDAFVHDLVTRSTSRASVAADGTQAYLQGLEYVGLSISGDGKWAAFSTTSPNIVPDDLNNLSDVFVHEVHQRTIIRVNTGGSSYTDSLGRVWQSDRGFNTGQTSHFNSPITNTNNPGLYQDERYDPQAAPDLHYAFTVPNATYLVRLHFAENYVSDFQAGKRVFNVDIEGVRRFSNVDIFAAVGARAALIESSEVTVVNGRLDIDFRRVVDSPLVDAIEIVEL